MTTHIFHVRGMHCKACTLLIEEALRDFPGVSSVAASLSANQVVVEGDFNQGGEELSERLSERIAKHGYTLSVDRQTHDAKWGDFVYAIPIAAIIIVAFIALQQAGLASFIGGGRVNLSTAFIIGLIASVSSCLAIVGGLVLSLSAAAAKGGETWKSLATFHVSRLAGFFVLGGAVGLLGNSLHLGLTANVVLGALVALVMLILGVNLLDIFHFTKRLQLTLPARFGRAIAATRHEHYLAPLLLGVATFFLPCGFTQSMQLYALSTGSFTAGALTMFVFALGTLPMLALLSFGSLNIAHKPWKGIFFKSAGLIVIALALINGANALATAGVIAPLFNF
jgi:uncharacterized protein